MALRKPAFFTSFAAFPAATQFRLRAYAFPASCPADA